MSEFIRSKMAGLDGNKPLSAPLVIDIRAGAPPPGALQTFREKTIAEDPSNELWEFLINPLVPGYFLIRNTKDGSYIFQDGVEGGAGLTTPPADQLPTGPEWSYRFVEDPAGSGFSFIQCALAGLVITVEGASRQERTGLHAGPLKPSDNDNQLWQAAFPFPVPLPTELSWDNMGTGSGTTGSDAAECSFTVSLKIQRDGACRFWGSYTNRGDTFDSTAPPQGFAVSVVVHDIRNAAYSFCQGGYVPSAPTPGCTLAWDFTGSSQVIRDNWGAIVGREQASYGCANSADPTAGSDVMEVLMQNSATAAGGGPLIEGSYFFDQMYPNTIYYGFGVIPENTMIVGGQHFGSAGSESPEGPPGWTDPFKGPDGAS